MRTPCAPRAKLTTAVHNAGIPDEPRLRQRQTRPPMKRPPRPPQPGLAHPQRPAEMVRRRPAGVGNLRDAGTGQGEDSTSTRAGIQAASQGLSTLSPRILLVGAALQDKPFLSLIEPTCDSSQARLERVNRCNSHKLSGRESPMQTGC